VIDEDSDPLSELSDISGNSLSPRFEGEGKDEE